MPDVDDSDDFDAASEVPYRRDLDFIRAATNVVRRHGIDIETGYDCTIKGEIPINAGTSSSSALVVSWVRFLLATQNGHTTCDAATVARLAYEAEVPEFNAPGGMMDHYASAMGGLLYIDCADPITVDRLPAALDGFVLGNTGVHKNNNAILRESREATTQGISILEDLIPGFDLRTTPFAQAEPHLVDMDHDIARRVRANLINRDICQQAKKVLSSEAPDTQQLGELLYRHQEQLREGIGVSHPKLDEFIDIAMEAGALGGKLNGSGGGGCMFAYAPGKEHEVRDAIRSAGGEAYVVSVSPGARADHAAAVGTD
jgi:galactokinase